MKKIRLIHYYLLLILIFGSLIIIAGCGGGGGDGDGGNFTPDNPDHTAPTVDLVTPLNNSTGAPVNQVITATFSEWMDNSTMNEKTFIVKQGATSITGTVTSVERFAKFVPSSALIPNTAYTATITTGATDLAGHGLAANYTWSFTTGSTSDNTAPAVSLVSPLNLATEVPLDQKIAATFSEWMDPLTINDTTFTLKQGATSIPGVVTYFGLVATFTPKTNLSPNTTYTATITSGANDLAGNALEANYTWSFTTGSGTDTTVPTVTLVNPLNLATGVPINQKIAATFSEWMDPATISSKTFTIKQGSTSVPGVVIYVGLVATFIPESNLIPNTQYTATVTTGAKDLAGNALAGNYVWSFTTGADADTTAPTVTLVNPLNLATGVPVNQKIAATFSEEMNPLTITSATFTLKQGTTPVTGVVTYIGQVATFTPSDNLAANTTYTATITTVAEDLAGNALAADYVWSFTTGLTADTTAPTITLVNPSNLATGVSLNKKIAASFSKPMDPLTVITTTFTLKQGTTPVTGVVTYIGQVATFTPSVNLTADTTYTATVTTGAKDLAGNALEANYVWSFTTGVVADTTAPTVTLEVPSDLATGVPTNQAVSATFSEAMDPITITNTTFTVNDGLIPVTGVVTYIGMIATFTPSSDLLPNTTYTATVTTGAKDLAGNALVAILSPKIPS